MAGLRQDKVQRYIWFLLYTLQRLQSIRDFSTTLYLDLVYPTSPVEKHSIVSPEHPADLLAADRPQLLLPRRHRHVLLQDLLLFSLASLEGGYSAFRLFENAYIGIYSINQL